MVLGVGNVKTVAGECEPLRAIESRFIKGAVSRARFTRADGIDECSIEFRNDDAVVIRVSYEQPISRSIRQYLAGKRKRQIADLRAFEHELEWLFVQLTTLPKLVDDLADGLIDDVVVSFAGRCSHDVTRGIDQHLCGPVAYAVALPHGKFGIVVNRVLDLVAQNDPPDVLRSEEHTSELQSQSNLVCRLLLEKKKINRL